MAKLAFNKSELHKQREQLKLYKKVLPSLDLKRKQLTAERNKARRILESTKKELQELHSDTAEKLPMLALEEIKLSGLVRIENVEMEEENVVGVRLPKLARVDYVESEYSMLAKPHWVDEVVERLRKALEMTVQIRVDELRLEKLEYAVRKVTQRVNLFEKILIPQAEENIKRIQIYLGEAERAAVVRSKITKKMRSKSK
jgi:V/A-type H+-transporting ATPase subunit D